MWKQLWTRLVNKLQLGAEQFETAALILRHGI